MRRMPGEFEEHEATVIIWPFRQDVWSENVEEVEKSFKKIIILLAEVEKVYIVVIPRLLNKLKTMFLNNKNISVFSIPSNDSWARDIVATFIESSNRLLAIDWQFNAWGGKEKGLYENYKLDNDLSKNLTERLAIKREALGEFILEGGSIHVDGEGTLITTEECLLNGGRNNTSKIQIEAIFKKHLGIEKVIWLKKGLEFDETNGHIDNLLTFVKPGEVLLAYTDDISNPHYNRVKSAYQILKQSTDAKGRSFKIHLIDLPKPMEHIFKKKRRVGSDIKEENLFDLLPASYVNLYIANDIVIVPIFNIPMDKQVINQLSNIFKNRRVIPIESNRILEGGGNIHCITQQIPKI